jgi:N-acetylglucosamine-6-sulfatase
VGTRTGVVAMNSVTRPAWRSHRLWAALLTLLTVAVLATGCLTTAPSAPRGPEPAAGVSGGPATAPAAHTRARAEAPERPNILLISSDDQNAADLQWMPLTRGLLGQAGMTFTHALSPHPLCCPARAEILTGQYAQNNGVQHNHGQYGGFKRLDTHQTIASWLQRAGYRTAFVGKYLNGYRGSDGRQPGWDIWNPMIARTYWYYGTRYLAGRPGDPRRYSVDAVGDRTVEYIRRWAPARAPFFIWASQVAPHASPTGPHSWGPPYIARRHAHVLGGVEAPSLRAPDFDVPGAASDGLVGDANPWTAPYIQHYFTQRIRSLQALDEATARAVRALRDAGELDNTYVFFTSDNGYLLGEHGLVGKNLLYEEDLHVPLLVRGPGVRRAATSRLPVTLVDLAPTFLQIAHARPGVTEDGTSLLGALRGNEGRWRDTQLVQTGSDSNSYLSGWTYRGVRTGRYTFGIDTATGITVLFDRLRDPRQLHDVADDPAYRGIAKELARRTRELSGCAGTGCNRIFGDPGEPRRQAHSSTAAQPF